MGKGRYQVRDGCIKRRWGAGGSIRISEADLESVLACRENIKIGMSWGGGYSDISVEE
jgi:hypothetical protein